METIKIIDGFVWAILTTEEAFQMYDNNQEVYQLYADGSEALILDRTDILISVYDSWELAAEIGPEAELLSDWQEACARNNETRSFEAWLEAKAESLIS